MIAVPEASSTKVDKTPFTVKVITAPGVPVNVTEAVFPVQIVVVPEIETVGAGTIVMIAVPVAGASQFGFSAPVISINVKVVF